jgi:hypothetical protein
MIEVRNTYIQAETWKIHANVKYASQVTLTDAEGKVVYEFPNVADGETLDLSNLPPGIYSIKLYNPAEEKYLKIVKH